MILLVSLAHADPEVDGVPLAAAQAIWQIELLRLPAASLATLLADPDPDVRARAARAVGRLRDAEGLTTLEPVVSDSSPRVRREVAFALGQTPESAAVLARMWAAEADRSVREELASALGKQGGQDAVDILVEALEGPTSVRAADGLGRLGIRKVEGASSDAVVAALLDTLRFPIGDTRRRSAWALARMGLARTSSENAVRMREIVLGDGDFLVRAWMLRAWAGVAAEASRAEVLAVTARDDAVQVRLATARAIARAGWPGAQPILVRLLDDPDLGVRLEAIAAVAECKGVDTRALLSKAWTSTEAVERAAALRVLAAADALPEPLSKFLDREDPMVVRVAAVESMKARGQLLTLALRSEDAPIRTAAVSALIGEDAPRLNEVLDLIAAGDLAVVQAAADALREHPDPGAERALLDLLRRRDLPPEVAESAVRALSAIYATGRLPRPGDDAAAVLRPWLRMRRLGDLAERFSAMMKVDPPEARHPNTKIPPLEEVLAIRSARIHTDQGEIRIDLAASDAPYTVWNFATLAEQGYYDGLLFHRVVADFVVQAGDPRGDGWGGPGWEIPDEINPISYAKGVVGMALSGPDTGGSQWFVTLSPQPHLDGTYTVFGTVTSGMRAANALQVGDRIQHVDIERRPWTGG